MTIKKNPIKFVPATRIARGALLLTLLAAAGCKVGPNYKEPDLMISSHWKYAESEGLVDGEPVVPGAWWDSFNDPILSDLIKQAQQENLDLQAAGMRVLQARSTKVRSIWSMIPLPVPSAGWTHINNSQNVKPDVTVTKPKVGRKPGKVTVEKGKVTVDRILPGGGVGDPVNSRITVNPPKVTVEKPEITLEELPGVSVSDDIDIYEVGAKAAWEPDIWGKDRRKIESNSALVKAALASYDDMSVILSAEIASTYIQIRAMQEQRAALTSRLEALGKLADGAKKGDGPDYGNAALAASLRDDTRAAIVDLDTGIEQFQNALCTLLGKTPGSLKDVLDAPQPIPTAPTKIAIGVPSDLLRRRPDVRIAEREAAAQCAQIGKVKANLYPTFKLIGSFGFSSSDTENLFQRDSMNYAYGVGFNWDILAYPFIQEQIRIEDAKYQEALMNFQNTVTRAAQEAEDAMIGYLNSVKKSKILKDSAQNADAASNASMAGFNDGKADFSNTFTAMEYQLAQTNKEIAARGASSLYMVKLYAALGGGWEVREGQPLVKPDVQEVMRKRTEWSTFDGKASLSAPR